MKATWPVLLVLMTAVITHAQQPPPGDNPSDVPKPVAASMQVQSGGPIARSTPNQRISGPIVQAARTGKPAQLINPLAPAKYGNGWANVSIEPTTGRAQGIKLLTFSFK